MLRGEKKKEYQREYMRKRRLLLKNGISSKLAQKQGLKKCVECPTIDELNRGRGLTGSNAGITQRPNIITGSNVRPIIPDKPQLNPVTGSRLSPNQLAYINSKRAI